MQVEDKAACCIAHCEYIFTKCALHSLVAFTLRSISQVYHMQAHILQCMLCAARLQECHDMHTVHVAHVYG